MMFTEEVQGFDGSTRDVPGEMGDPLDPERPVAVFLVGGEDALGPAAFGLFGSRYAEEYPQILFVSIGILDQAVFDGGADRSGNFKGSEEAERLQCRTRDSLRAYLKESRSLGMKAAYRVSVSVDAAQEIARLSDEISAAHPKAVYFLAKLVFKKPRWFHRWLYSGTSDAIRRKLEQKGRPVTVLPVVVAL